MTKSNFVKSGIINSVIEIEIQESKNDKFKNIC